MPSKPGRGLRATCKTHHFIALKPVGHGLLHCALQESDRRLTCPFSLDLLVALLVL